MIEIGNKRWRNLQEQVAWLTAMIGQATDVVKNIYGTVADAASLPDASTFSNGTTYAVGSAAPFEYYVAINGSWLDIGTFPLEGPAGTDGEDGKSIFITSQATTSGTTQILIASVYNPASLTIDAGDLILSEQGDIFAVTGSSVSTLYVIYRCNIKGPQGVQGDPGSPGSPGSPGADGTDGINVLTSSATTTSSTTAIQTSTINVPTGYTAKAGDMIVTSTGDVFISRGPASLPGYTDVTYCYNIKGDAGSPGTPGVDGATWYEGSDMIYDSVGHTYDLSTTDAPGIAVGDLYLISSDYTSDGHDFTRGDIFVVNSIAGTTADCGYVGSILGPQGGTGATGADGATWYSGTDVIHTGGSGGAYVIPLSSLPDLKVGDLYLVTSTYTSDGETLNNGDVWAVYSIADPYAVMTFRTNLVSGGNGIYYASTTTSSSTVSIPKADVSATLQAGDLIISASGDLFECLGELDANNWSVTYKMALKEKLYNHCLEFIIYSTSNPSTSDTGIRFMTEFVSPIANYGVQAVAKDFLFGFSSASRPYKIELIEKLSAAQIAEFQGNQILSAYFTVSSGLLTVSILYYDYANATNKSTVVMGPLALSTLTLWNLTDHRKAMF